MNSEQMTGKKFLVIMGNDPQSDQSSMVAQRQQIY